MRLNAWKKDLCAPRLRACGMAQNTFKTHGSNRTRREHTSRRNVLTKHFHMVWLQPDFSLCAKALWAVKCLFSDRPALVITTSSKVLRYASACVIQPAAQRLTSHWGTRYKAVQNSHSSCLVRYKNQHIPDHLLFRANVPLTQPLNL